MQVPFGLAYRISLSLNPGCLSSKRNDVPEFQCWEKTGDRVYLVRVLKYSISQATQRRPPSYPLRQRARNWRQLVGLHLFLPLRLGWISSGFKFGMPADCT